MRTPIALLLLAATTASAQVSVGHVRFLDRAARGQITLGNVRGSVGIIDFDNDGWQDVFVADIAGRSDRLFRNIASPTSPGGRSFQDVSMTAGFSEPDGLGRGAGAVLVLDFNNDGFRDIYTGSGSIDGSSGVLYRNNGNGTFTNVTLASGIRLPQFAVDSAAAIDFDHDGFTDIFLSPVPSFTAHFTLLRNNGNGTFTSRADLLPLLQPGGRVYASTWSDYNNDGWEDALICIDAGVPLTLKNVPAEGGGRRLVNATIESGFTTIGRAPMGIAPGDFDGDGDIDLAITDAVVGTYFENVNGTFEEIFPFRTFFGWGTTWLDAENDGDLDNYQAGSFSSASIDYLFRNDGLGALGRIWTNARPALNTTPLASQYCARVDFDNDGREDIITVNPNNFISIYHNQSTSNFNWSKISLTGLNASPAINADAVGALVRLSAGGVTQTREVAIGTSFNSAEDPRPHFGLGEITTIDRIEVRWPRQGTLSSRTQTFHGPFPANTILSLSPTTPTPPCLDVDVPTVSAPADAQACNSGEVTFTIEAGGSSPHSYQWQFRGGPTAPPYWSDLADGVNSPQGQFVAHALGTNEPTLRITRSPANWPTNTPPFEFRCVVTNACGTAHSPAATLSVCPGDYNCDGGIDGTDISAFFTRWEAGC